MRTRPRACAPPVAPVAGRPQRLSSGACRSHYTRIQKLATYFQNLAACSWWAKTKSVAEVAGACRHVRASEKHALGNECIRQLSARRPAGYRGVRIGRCPGSSGAGGPCRGLVLRERIRIRAVAGIRPGWSANPGCGRRLVRPARWPDGHPCAGLAAGQPQRQRRHGEVRRGYPPCHPGTRPDMAGRQRQPVPVTHPAHPLPGIWAPARMTPIRARHAA
jgi:hypothetical protein